MATLIGKQKQFGNALQALLELDYDAIEAYKKAIERLENSEYKNKLSHFCADHERHVQELRGLLVTHNLKPPEGPDIKQWLTKGKVVIANIAGDKAILKAMHSNVKDANIAYEHVNRREDVWSDAHDTLSRAWADEKRHKAWIEQALA